MRQGLVLVTGAHGFVGRHTAKYFAKQGWTVIGMGHGTWSRDEWSHWGLKEWRSCDITLENLLCFGKSPEAIIHCAGSGSVAFSMSHPYLDYQRTIGTTLSVLEFIRLHLPSAKLVYPSSAAVYGNVLQLQIGRAHV
jgi:UDP-glucose 4-epimerase